MFFPFVSLSLFYFLICFCFLTGISWLSVLDVPLISFSVYSTASQLGQG